MVKEFPYLLQTNQFIIAREPLGLQLPIRIGHTCNLSFQFQNSDVQWTNIITALLHDEVLNIKYMALEQHITTYPFCGPFFNNGANLFVQKINFVLFAADHNNVFRNLTLNR